jgi:hypothetical protein
MPMSALLRLPLRLTRLTSRRHTSSPRRRARALQLAIGGGLAAAVTATTAFAQIAPTAQPAQPTQSAQASQTTQNMPTAQPAQPAPIAPTAQTASAALTAQAKAPASASAPASTPGVQTFALTDTKNLVERNVKAEAVEYLGRKAVRVTKTAEGEGLALLTGTDFQDGTIEADLAVKTNTPPGVRNPGFIGVAFRVRQDVSHYDLFYIRPGNARADDQAMRNHAVQYCAAPNFGWYELRRAWPWVYEAYGDIQRDAWTHIKIDVAGRVARIYLNGSAMPTLVVDGMKGEDLRGAVALFGFTNEESYFSNLRITHATPQAVKNGGDATGTWQVQASTDTGPFAGTMQLHREGTAVTGTWSGELGENRPVTGTWRDGYVELTFAGEWPKERGTGTTGPATATLAGWIDGDGAKGRMRVEGRTDGQWNATHKP